MAHIRLVMFFAVALLFIGSALSKRKSHDLIVGLIGFRDRVIYSEVIHVPRQESKIVEKEISYTTPVYFRAPTTYIHYIRIKDLKKDGTGAYPTIISGGPRNREVVIGFQSQRSRGIDFNVTIYGSI